MTLWQIWWLALVIKTCLLPFLPITPDEAYYMAWARHPALSYFDHPPYISWIMAAGLPFWKTTLTVRWPGVLFNHLSLIPWFMILKKLRLSPRAQIFWLLLVLFGPLTGVGAFIVTPDTPLLFFWSAAMWALLWTMEKPTMPRWALTGLFIGLGLLSKYMMILFFPAAFLWLLWEDHWKILKTPGPWVAALTALAVFSPVILWNVENGMASFTFQGQHGLGSAGFHPKWMLEYVSAQFGLLNPFAAALAVWVIVRNYSKQKFLVVFGIFPLLFFFMTSFKGRVEANWPVCAYPSVLALAASALDLEGIKKRAASWLKAGIAVSALFLIVITSHVIHPWLPIPPAKDHTRITREWQADVNEVKDLQPLYARSYQMAAFLSYYRDPSREVFKLSGLDRKDFYDFLPESKPKKDAFLILREKEILPPKLEDLYVLSNPKPLPGDLVVYELSPRHARALK